jgi:hypothetical protein
MSSEREPIHVTIPGSPRDPRTQRPPDGVVIHSVSELHPDDVTTLPNGLRVTSVARTLVDVAECMTQNELHETFEIARRKGLLDIDDVRASRSRVEWRPSLAMLDEVIAEFDD